MAAQNGGGGGDVIEDKDAKHLLDSIGKIVHKEVKKEAQKRSNGELKGNLKKATNRSVETLGSIDPCTFEYNELAGGDAGGDAGGERYPCGNGSGKGEYVNRFSDKEGAECHWRKIKDSKNYRGACAPYRRLHVCDKNMEYISDYDSSNAKHNLLVDVCMAAKYEGESIKTHYPKYQYKYGDSPSQICTMLARSFADIGDIVRGKDLYRGDKGEKKKLEERLKTMFGNIKKNNEDKLGHLSIKQVREFWWALNRDQVWKAITCNDVGAQYFRNTCSNGQNKTQNNCRCDGDQVPTYFDYVPQYLRWFEEWAEDFCRKRKHKLKDAKSKCREQDKDGKKLYCDLNRHDCVETIRGNHVFVEDDDCKDCHYSCSHFVKWIDKQKVEFDKQRKKYQTEITGGGSGRSRKKQSETTKVYDGYEKKFYEKFKGKCGTVNVFLGLLSKETTCKDPPQEGTEKADPVDFTEDTHTTFSHTEYCQACPWCGAEQESGGGWKNREDTKCDPARGYDGYEDTEIQILTGDKGQSDILKKYSKFCKNGGNGATGTVNDGEKGEKGDNKEDNQIKTWQCYYKKNENDVVKKDINFCVLQNNETVTSKKNSMHYNAFFWKWVYDMLHDSVEWRKQLGNCINNNTTGNRCKKKNKCNRECGCFLQWVKQKQQEWKAIKEHFYKQENIPGNCYFSTLEFLLRKEELLKIIEGTYGKPEDIKHIEELLDEEERKNKEEAASTGAFAGGAFGGFGIGGDVPTCSDSDNEKETIMDKLLQHEEGIAKDCQSKHQDPCPQPSTPEGAGDGVGRAQTPLADGTKKEDSDDESEDSGSENEEDEGGGEEPAASEETAEDTTEDTEQEVDGDKGEKGPKEEVDPKVCETVDKALKVDNLTKACQQKYDGKYYGWKCVTPTGSGSTATSGAEQPTRGSGEPTKSSDSGSICVPPRRRRLYVKKIHDWASDKTLHGGESSPGGEKSPQESGEAAASQEGQVKVNDKEGASSSSSDSNSVGQTASQSGDKLRDAFIQSAAIETFFLWHKYKTVKQKELDEKKKQQQENGGATYGLFSGNEDTLIEQDPEDKLKKGIIPDGFLRQMFYTLGDYADIFFGKNDILIKNTNSANAKDEMADKENKIKDAIERVLKNGDSQPPTVKTPSEPGDKRTALWKDFAPSIWNGMIYALTYNTDSGDKGKPPTEDPAVRAQLWDSDKNKPKNHEYEKVQLDENSETQAKDTKSQASGGKKTNEDPLNNPKLTQFVEIPPFFRWLHEWGSDFCGKRARMLKDVKDNCMRDGTKQYSGDGEDCKTIREQKYDIFSDLEGPKCAKPCRFYKKWIKKKRTEYDKQKGIYNKEYENAQMNNGGNGFSKILRKCTDAAEFLKMLGPCKPNNGEGKTIFDENGETFQHAKDCKPCSQFKINCRNGKCTSGGINETCNGIKTITKEDIEQMKENIQLVDMYVSDDSTNGFKGDDLKACIEAGIFKGIRKDVWTCGNVCGYVVCKPKNGNGEAKGKHIIQIRALVKRWVEYFFEDYNKIKKKLNPCTKNDQESTCIKDCVEKWVQQKRKEWDKIKNLLNEQYKGDNAEMDASVRSSLVDLINGFAPKIDKGRHKGSVSLVKLFKCNCDKKSENSGGNDPVKCLLEKLKDKIDECKKKPSGSEPCTQTTPEKTPTSLEEDEEDLLLEEVENENTLQAKKNMMPKICETVVQTTEPTEQADEKCEEATTEPVTPAKSGEGTEKAKPPPATPTEPQRPQPQPPQPDLSPLKTALVTSTLAWSVGIGFAAFTYFYLKVLNIYMYICGYICVLCIYMY